MLSTRTTVGSIGMLAHHKPLLGMLDPTELRLYRSESDIVRFAQGEGYLQVGDNRALVLVEEAIAPGELDVSSCGSACARPSRPPRRRGGHRAERRAQRDKRRWEAFLRIAGS